MPERVRFARRVSVRTKPDKSDEFVSVMKDAVYPGLSRERGIRRIYLLRDAKSPNEFESLTLWDSSGDAAAYESAGHFSANTEKIREYLERDPVASQFDVVYHAVSPAVPSSVGGAKTSQEVAKGKATRKTSRTLVPFTVLGGDWRTARSGAREEA